MRFEVTTEAQARDAVEYFNAFHDGFVRRLAVVSHDVFESRGVHASSRAPDLELLLAHYNYQRDERPIDQLVRATFLEVTELTVVVSGLGYETAIKWLAVEAGERVREARTTEPCLRATLVLPQLGAGNAWEERDAVAFAFARATFEEV
jgi:hypothetical protein